MNTYQKAGLKAVWELIVPIFTMLVILVGIAGLGYLIAQWTHSAATGLCVASVVFAVGVYGWLIRDTYRRGVRNAKEEEERTARYAKEAEERAARACPLARRNGGTEQMSEPHYSQDIIRRYREMYDAHAFLREVTEDVPVDLNYDQMTLSCGHQHRTFRLMAKAGDGKVTCEICVKEWLDKAVDDEKRGAK
jgi:hypothetical protein